MEKNKNIKGSLLAVLAFFLFVFPSLQPLMEKFKQKCGGKYWKMFLVTIGFLIILWGIAWLLFGINKVFGTNF